MILCGVPGACRATEINLVCQINRTITTPTWSGSPVSTTNTFVINTSTRTITFEDGTSFTVEITPQRFSWKGGTSIYRLTGEFSADSDHGSTHVSYRGTCESAQPEF